MSKTPLIFQKIKESKTKLNDITKTINETKLALS